MKRCDGSPTLKNMSRLFCAILVDTATLQQNETICPHFKGPDPDLTSFLSAQLSYLQFIYKKYLFILIFSRFKFCFRPEISTYSEIVSKEGVKGT